MKLKKRPYAPTVKNFLDIVMKTKLGITLDELFADVS